MVGPAKRTLEIGPYQPSHVRTATWLILPVIQELIHAQNPKLTDSYLVGPASNSGANTCTKPRIYVPGLRRFEVIRSFWIQGVPGLGRTQWYANRFVPDFAGPFLTIALNFLDLFLCCIALLGGPNN